MHRYTKETAQADIDGTFKYAVENEKRASISAQCFYKTQADIDGTFKYAVENEKRASISAQCFYRRGSRNFSKKNFKKFVDLFFLFKLPKHFRAAGSRFLSVLANPPPPPSPNTSFEACRSLLWGDTHF